MKSLIFLVVLCCAVVVCLGAVSRGIFSDPKHPGKCVIKPDLILSPGEHQNPDECGRIICHDDGSAEFHTCGVVQPPEGFVLGPQKHPKADYPDCCVRHFVKSI